MITRITPSVFHVIRSRALALGLTLASGISATPPPSDHPALGALRSEDIDPSGPVVHLSEMAVDGRVKLKRLEDDWRSARIGQLEILSNADPALTEESIAKLQQLEHALTLIFPQLRTRPRQPLTIVFCGNRRSFESFRHRGKTSAEGEAASVFVHDADRAIIVVDLDYYPPNRQRRLYRIYTHYLLNQLARPLPASLAEGIARVFSLTEIEGETLTLAQLRPIRTRDFALEIPTHLITQLGFESDSLVRVTAIRDELWDSLSHRPLIPFEQLFATNYDSPDFLNPVNNPFAIQSLAFVHMCLFGRTPSHRDAFLKLLSECDRQPLTPELFTACFGKNYATLETDLRAYIETLNFSVELRTGQVLPVELPKTLKQQIDTAIRKKFSLPSVQKGGPPIVSGKYAIPSTRLPETDTSPIPAFRKASYADIAHIKADALMMAGHYDEAREELLSAVMRKHADARAFASFGFLARATQEPGVSLHYLRKSARAAVDLPGPYIYLAQQKLAAARLVTPDGISTDEAEAAATLRLLYTARRFIVRPRLDLYETLAATWSQFSLLPTRADLDVLAEKLAYFQSPQLSTIVAALFQKHGHPEEAAAITDRARNSPLPLPRSSRSSSVPSRPLVHVRATTSCYLPLGTSPARPLTPSPDTY